MTTNFILIDEHQIVRDGVRLRLNRESDFRIVGEAGNATEAYHCLQHSSVHVVILDVVLRDENGIAALLKVKVKSPAVKTIVLTGSADGEVVHEALRAGADGFIRKEGAGDFLVPAIRTILQGNAFICPLAITALAALLRRKERVQAGPKLSTREAQLLQGIAAGLSYKMLSHQLNVSVKSVETYRTRLAKKLGLATRAEFVRYAAEQG